MIHISQVGVKNVMVLQPTSKDRRRQWPLWAGKEPSTDLASASKGNLSKCGRFRQDLSNATASAGECPTYLGRS